MLIFKKNNKEKVLIFGAGSGAINFYKSNKSHYEIIGFIDNNKKKQGLLLFNKQVFSPCELSKINYEKIIIASDYYKEIYEQLVNQLDVSEEKISVFHLIDTVKISIWKKIFDAITEYKYNWLCNSESWLFNFIYIHILRNSKLQLRNIVWLDEMEECKIKVFRHEKLGKVYGPNFFEKNTTIKLITIPEIALYRLLHGKISSINRSIIMNNENVVIDRVVTASLNDSDYSGGHLVRHGKKRAIVKLFAEESLEKGIAIIGGSETNYYHWMIEILSQLQYVNELPDEYLSYPLLISNWSEKIHSIHEFLNYFDIKHPIVFLHSTQSYLVGELLLINSPNNLVPNLRNNAWSPVENSFVRYESLNYLRQLAFNMPKCESKTDYSIRIFLARKNFLRSYNQKEVYDVLHQYGFKEVFFEELSFSEQVKIMQNAKMIVGPTGAAWTNLIFGKKGARALCWMAEEVGDLSCFSNLAKFADIQMSYMTYKANTNNTREIYYRSYSINVEAIRRWVVSNLE